MPAAVLRAMPLPAWLPCSGPRWWPPAVSWPVDFLWRTGSFRISFNVTIMSDVQQLVKNTDFEVRSLDTLTATAATPAYSRWHVLRYIAVRMLLGIVFVKGEIISWFRIQEMFRLQSFHMYGVIGSA